MPIFTRCGLIPSCRRRRSRPAAAAICSGETVTAPCPIATEIVSPAYHFCRDMRIFHLVEGMVPCVSLGRSIPVLRPIAGKVGVVGHTVDPQPVRRRYRSTRRRIARSRDAAISRRARRFKWHAK